MERQIHGFKEEDYLFKNYPLFKTDLSYTAKWDGLIKEKYIIGGNSQQEIIPVSIKTKKLGANVEMGSFIRNATLSEDFLLSVAFWNGNKDNIVKRDFLLIPQNVWLENFPNFLIDKMEKIFIDNNISNFREDDMKWRKVSKEYKDLWNRQKTGIDIHFKRDHKTQKRIQCSIKKDYFYRELLPKYKVDILPVL